MNTVVTSKEQILKASRELIQRQGWSAVNIRSVAAACGVSVGSIYNYFDSKAALVGAAVESVWCEIFHRPEDGEVFQNTAGLCYLDVRTDGIWLQVISRFFHPPLAGLHAGGQDRRETADAADLAAHSGRPLFRFEARRKSTARRFYGAVFGGGICGRFVFPDAVRPVAAGL